MSKKKTVCLQIFVNPVAFSMITDPQKDWKQVRGEFCPNIVHFKKDLK